MPYYNHIIFEGRTISLPYGTFGRGQTIKRHIYNRDQHGNKIKKSFEEAVNRFNEGDEEYEFVYIEFESAVNFELEIDKFENIRGDIRLASCKRIVINSNAEGQEDVVYRASVYLNRRAVGTFLLKLAKYINENTQSGNPRYEGLVANIEEIRAATLKSFWQEPLSLFPEDDKDVWWEIWLDREPGSVHPSQLFYDKLSDEEVQIGSRILVFPEHIIVLVKGTPIQLRNTLLYIGQLAEIRKPLETADFFTYLDHEWQNRFIDDLNTRVIMADDSRVSICLLDTGLNLSNPLLRDIVSESNLESVERDWTNSDTHIHGHGTPMAGLILYGDLTDALTSTETIHICYLLESIKIIERSEPNNPDLYGKIILEAVSLGEIFNPENKRIVCLAISAPDNHHFGKPSSWSSAIDQLSFGSLDDRNNKTLILISSGNLSLEARLESPISNDTSSIQDPAQAFNALTVGAFTLKDHIDVADYPGAELLANRGNMAPCNTTSICWDKHWPRKPDIVMEGGNDGIVGGGIFYPDSLKLLTTSKGGIGRSWLKTFGDTSASTALASKLSAELYYEYPDLWPETIRGLIVHSANWTPAMLYEGSIQQLSSEDKKKLICRVGYGVPNLKKAINSANNSLTLIAQRTITPFKYESRIKPNEFHLVNLPWPTDVLTGLAENQVTLIVTLSYFIEPNPGNKRYANSTTYRSHGLRFKMIDRTESETRFKARVSRVIRDEQVDYAAEGTDNWILGSQIRDKGSIHKDLWMGNAADLAMRNKIAVYPVGGWWKDRKNLSRYESEVRYSLIVSIETESQDVDIYNPVVNQIELGIEV